MNKQGLEKDIQFEKDLIDVYYALIGRLESEYLYAVDYDRIVKEKLRYMNHLKISEKRLRRLQMIKKVKDWFAKILSNEEIVIPQIPVEDTAWVNLPAENRPVRKSSKKGAPKKSGKKSAPKKTAAKNAGKKSSKKKVGQ